eukprot:SAG22_NODE_128_length_18787_cov_19.577108_13_plen_290_part_00
MLAESACEMDPFASMSDDELCSFLKLADEVQLGSNLSTTTVSPPNVLDMGCVNAVLDTSAVCYVLSGKHGQRCDVFDVCCDGGEMFLEDDCSFDGHDTACAAAPMDFGGSGNAGKLFDDCDADHSTAVAAIDHLEDDEILQVVTAVDAQQADTARPTIACRDLSMVELMQQEFVTNGIVDASLMGIGAEYDTDVGAWSVDVHEYPECDLMPSPASRVKKGSRATIGKSKVIITKKQLITPDVLRTKFHLSRRQAADELGAHFQLCAHLFAGKFTDSDFCLDGVVLQGSD